MENKNLGQCWPEVIIKWGSKRKTFPAGKDILMFPAMDKAARTSLYDVVATMEGIRYFSVGAGTKKRVALIRSRAMEPGFDARELSRAGNEAYKNGEYETCIECYKKILYCNKRLKSNTFAQIGRSLMHLGIIKDAILYLEIANELGIEEGCTCDYSDLILKLKGGTPKEEPADIKEKTYMTVKDFTLDEHYGIEHLDTISRRVTCEGMTLEEACKEYDYSPEQIHLIRLIYVKEYYSNGDYALGDKVMNFVAKSPDKTPFVKKELEEIRRRRQFYKNRPMAKKSCFVYMYE